MRRALLAFLAFALAAPCAAQLLPMRADVLVVESIDAFHDWMLQQPPPKGTYPTLTEVPAGKPVYFPIIATDLRPPAQGRMTIVGDIEFLGPDGKPLAAAKACCRFEIEDRPDVQTAVLGNAISLQLGTGDARGTYTVRVSVTDGRQVAQASRQFTFSLPDFPSAAREAPAAMPRAAPKGPAPRLQMNPPPRNPGRDADKRDCLDLPTPAEVIRCTERK